MFDLDVDFDEYAERLSRRLEISRDEVEAAIAGGLTGASKHSLNKHVTRLAVVHEFKNGRIIFVESRVTGGVDYARDTGFPQVNVLLAIELLHDLPAGRWGSDTDFVDILDLVARSFGRPVVCHLDEPSSFLYSGRWDGKTFKVSTSSGPVHRIFGAGDSASLHCELVWAINVNDYCAWQFKELLTKRYARAPGAEVPGNIPCRARRNYCASPGTPRQ